jgi:quinol monooxygenase YgiN
VYARSTTIQAQPWSIDRGIAHVNHVVMPALSDMAGCRGMSLLVDRESGRCIVTSSWEDRETMRASAELVGPLRDRAGEIFRGRPVVDEWEIAVLHRRQHSLPGACVRATWLRARPQQFERAIDFYRMAVLPAIEEFAGFCSASLMVDAASARAVASVTFDSMAAMDRSAAEACSLRTALLRDLGVDQYDVGEFALAIAHLNVPVLV